MIGLVAFAFTLSLNYKYASNDYGILNNSLSVQVLASGGSGGSGGSGVSGTCATHMEQNYYEERDELVQTYDCVNGEGMFCNNGYMIYLYVSTNKVLTYYSLQYVICY